MPVFVQVCVNEVLWVMLGAHVYACMQISCIFSRKVSLGHTFESAFVRASVHARTDTHPHTYKHARSIFLARRLYRSTWGLLIVWPRAKMAWFTDGAATAQVRTY